MRTRLARLLLAAARRLDPPQWPEEVDAYRVLTRPYFATGGSIGPPASSEGRTGPAEPFLGGYCDCVPGAQDWVLGAKCTVHSRGGGIVAKMDAARPAPTSVADAVCMCCYGADGERDYRCRVCVAGFGPDRERQSTPWEQWSRRHTD